MPAGSDEVVEFGEFDDDPIVVVLVEGSLLKVFLYESGFQGPVCSFLWGGTLIILGTYQVGGLTSCFCERNEYPKKVPRENHAP